MGKRVTHFVYVRVLVPQAVEEGTSPEKARLEAEKSVKTALNNSIGAWMKVVDSDWSRMES